MFKTKFSLTQKGQCFRYILGLLVPLMEHLQCIFCNSFFFSGGHLVIEKTKFHCDLESSWIFVHVCTNADTLDSEQERQLQWSFLTNHFLCVSLSSSWNGWIFVSNQMFSSESLLTYVCDRQQNLDHTDLQSKGCIWKLVSSCLDRTEFFTHNLYFI